MVKGAGNPTRARVKAKASPVHTPRGRAPITGACAAKSAASVVQVKTEIPLVLSPETPEQSRPSLISRNAHAEIPEIADLSTENLLKMTTKCVEMCNQTKIGNTPLIFRTSTFLPLCMIYDSMIVE